MLTDDDIRKISDLIAGSEARLLTRIEMGENQLQALIAGSENRMQALIAGSEARLLARIEMGEDQLKVLIAGSENRMQALIADSEARLLARIEMGENQLQALIAGSEARLLTRIRDGEERTANLIAAEIGASHTATHAAIQAAVEGVTAEIARTTAEAIEASENRLLIAFHQWASPIDTRVRAHSMAIGAFDGEKQNAIEQMRKIAELERRIEKLERAS